MDYIHARLAYRNELLPQFLWSSLQAIEKYLKAILLYNRVEAKDVNHSLAKGLKYTAVLPFEIRLSPVTGKFIEYVDKYGANRYLDWSYFIRGPKLVELDKAVWEIRRYCHVLNYSWVADGIERSALADELKKIERAELEPPQKFRPFTGVLEEIIDKPGHPSRNALIWQNAFFGKTNRKMVRMKVHSNFTNAPLTLKPELLDELEKFIKIPDKVRKAYSNELRKRSSGHPESAGPAKPDNKSGGRLRP